MQIRGVELCEDVTELVWRKCASNGATSAVCREAYVQCSSHFQTHMHAFMTWRVVARLRAMRRPIRLDEGRVERFEAKYKLLVLPRHYANQLSLSMRVPFMLFHTYWGVAVRLRRHGV
jgi:hypothetical protein